MKRLLIIFLLMSSLISAADFNVTWTPIKEDIVNKEYIVTIQNLDTDMRTVDVKSFFEDTNFDTSKIQDVEFYEQIVKPVMKEIKHYKTIQVSETISHIDNKTGMLINITKIVNKSVLDYIEKKTINEKVFNKQKTQVLKNDKKMKEVSHGKITLSSIKTKGKINNAGTKTFILKFKTPPDGSYGKVGLKINGKEYHPYWNSTWSNRKKITLTGTSSGSQTDYQLLLNVTYEPEMNSDFSDVRFCNDTDQLSAWLESKINESYALIWVKFPHIPDNGETEDYWMYYGNSEASACWDGNATFEFFDDFEYDDDLINHGWTIEHGTYNSNYNTVTDYAKRGSRSLKIYPASRQIVSLYRALSPNNRYACEVDYYETDPAETSIHTFLINNNLDERLACYDMVTYRTRYNSTWHESLIARSLGWHKLGILRDGTSVYFMVDGTEADSYANSNNIINSGLYSGSSNSGWDSSRYWDSFRVRKYTSLEPTYAFNDTGYYVNSIYFNFSNPYYNLIDYKGDIVVNHSYYPSDDLEWTAQAVNNDTGFVVTSMGSSEIDFITYEGILNWLQLVNLDDSKIYTLQNSSGDIEEHQASGNAVNFTTDLSPDDYEIEITDAISPTPTPEPSLTTLHDIKMSDKSIKEMYYPFMYILFIVIIIGGFMHVFGN